MRSGYTEEVGAVGAIAEAEVESEQRLTVRDGGHKSQVRSETLVTDTASDAKVTGLYRDHEK
ncbi:MAG: hypothetical protein J5379_01760 [Clostridiales bacterium]|nr:hypothetical protein [Clostridiales bacterium]